MPLNDCMLLLKPHVKKEPLIDVVAKIGKHVYRRNGVVTDMKSFGTVQLGYGIKKLDGRYYQGQLMQLTMMTPPSFNSELHYLTKEDRLLRWLLVKHRDVQLGAWSEDGLRGANPMRDDFRNYRIELHDPEEGGGVFSRGSSDDEDDDDDDDYENENEEDEKEG